MPKNLKKISKNNNIHFNVCISISYCICMDLVLERLLELKKFSIIFVK